MPGFVAAQLVGLLAGVGLLAVLYPDAGVAAEAVVVPQESTSVRHGRGADPAPASGDGTIRSH